MQTPDDPDEFARAVYEIVGLIPWGRATSYGAVARAAGRPGGARQVGRLMGRGEGWSEELPAHRVVNSQGVLSGEDAFGVPGEMRRRLAAEGIPVEGNRIRRWKEIFWDPLLEL